MDSETTSQLHALCFDALDPPGLASFWASILGREVGEDGVTLLPDGEPGFLIRFLPTQEPKTGRNQMHFDLPSPTWEAQRQTVAKVLELGGRHYDVGQLPEEEHVVVADPEDNEFCVIEPGNNFLAGCGVIGALSSDGLADVGHFWSVALGWPLVWDQDEETAIQSPYGGSKISWGGPPVEPKTGRNRLRFDLAPPAGVDQETEVARLVSLGATRAGRGDGGAVAMTDPGGNEFCVLPGS